LPDLADLQIRLEPLSTSHSESLSRHTILSQQLFLRMLCLERKRSERSGRRLVLMLLESSALLRAPQSNAIDGILLSLSRSTRDTDITGWYQEGSILGVLFTEIGATETSVVDILSHKVHQALHEVLGIHHYREVTVSFHVFPDDCQGQDSGRRAFSVLYPDLMREIESKRASFAAKRFIDIAGSLSLLILLAPLLLLIACVVRLTSRGPILFRQKRLGQFGEGFSFLKFRSMYAKTDHAIHEEYVKRFISKKIDFDGSSEGRNVFKLQNDPRVTRVGKFLRRTSLDELPQLFNVLTGRMSLVGPRPPLPYEFESYEVWHRRRLLAVKPGITGFWQVEGRSRVKFDDMVRMDLQYARTWSVWLDIKILLRTPRAVFTGNGAC
jgi:lipopolysaccharide/colanic/teichoic acid biosynthesis glycosyltransferase